MCFWEKHVQPTHSVAFRSPARLPDSGPPSSSVWAAGSAPPLLGATELNFRAAGWSPVRRLIPEWWFPVCPFCEKRAKQGRCLNLFRVGSLQLMRLALVETLGLCAVCFPQRIKDNPSAHFSRTHTTIGIIQRLAQLPIIPLMGGAALALRRTHMFLTPSLVAQKVRNPPAMQETQVQSLGWDDPLEKGMAIPLQ